MNDKILLQKISTYNGKKNLIVSNQTTGDIITGIIEMQQKYCNDYKKLLPYFEADNLEDTANNVFEYLKNNFKYVIESENLQSLRSPSAIISTGKKIGIDCKQYSLFFAGILSEYIKKYNLKNKLYFRFAGYEGKPIGHVFVYFLDDNKKEIWCDCVLNYLNDRSIEPTIYKDKLINMALITISGVPRVEGLVPSYESIGKSQQVWNNYQTNKVGVIPIAAASAAFKTGATILKSFDPNQVKEVIEFISNVFGAKKGAAATPYAEKKYLEMYPDVARDPGFARNPWKHFQENGWREGRYWFDNETVTKETIDDYRNRYPDVARTWDNSILQHYLEYGKSEGRTIKLLMPDGTVETNGNNVSNNNSGGGNLPTTKAGLNPLLLIGLIGAGAFIFLNKKK
jgi:hypothetical protein